MGYSSLPKLTADIGKELLPNIARLRIFVLTIRSIGLTRSHGLNELLGFPGTLAFLFLENDDVFFFR